MKIAIVSTSATLGGAAIATARMADALQEAGQEVKLFTADDLVRSRTFPFLLERGEIFLRNGLSRPNLFKGSTARFGRSGLTQCILDWQPDAIILGWINQGLMSLGQVEELLRSGLPVVWVMHDMWNLTGFCHHMLGCRRFTGRCGRCPLLGSPARENDLSRRGWEEKHALYRYPNLQFVAVSQWLAQEAKRSTLLRDKEIRVIPNVFPLESFQIGQKEPGLIVMGAARLDDHIKGLPYAIEALNLLQGHPTAHVAFFGDLRNRTALNSLRIPYEHLGSLNAAEVSELLSRAEVVLSSSLYETFGLTLLEGQASGCIPVSFDRGGQTDIITHLHTGYLVPFGNVATLARGLAWALDAPLTPASLRAWVAAHFSPRAVAAALLPLLHKDNSSDAG